MNDDYPPRDAIPASPSAASAERRATWGPWALLIVSIIVGLLPLASFLGGSDTDDQEIDRNVLIASGLISLVWYMGIASIVYFAARRSGGGWTNLGFRTSRFAAGNVFDRVRGNLRRILKVRLPHAIVVPLLGYAMAYFCVVAYSIVTTALGLNSLEPNQQIPSEVFNDGVVITIIGLGVLVAAPLVEEMFFRGFLFGGLRRWMPFLPAAMISGFLFSLAHQDVGLIIPFTLVGMVLAYTYEKTGTLFGSISVHFVFNFVSFALLLLVPDFRGE